MLYYTLNAPDFYTHDPNIALNDEYYSKIYDDSEMLNINLFKNNTTSFISNFDMEHYELSKEKNNVINTPKYKNFKSNEKEEWIRHECFVSSTILYNSTTLYNNIDQETEYLSTYENELPGSITNSLNIEYNIELGILRFPINL